jgi:NTE family protein
MTYPTSLEQEHVKEQGFNSDQTQFWISQPKKRFDSHRELLLEGLTKIFGDFDAQLLEQYLPRVNWIELAGDQILVREGDEDRSLYFVISGRLRATRTNMDGEQQTLGDISHGETIGEMAFFTHQRRAASVYALRDCVLARFSEELFKELLIAYPLLSINLTRLVIERQQRSANARIAHHKPATLAVLSLHEGLQAHGFAKRLCQEISKHGKTSLITASHLGLMMGDSSIAQAPLSDVERSRLVTHHLEQVEIDHRFVVFVCDNRASEWTQRCLRHCDDVIMLADFDGDSKPSAIEQQCLQALPGQIASANRTLILQHNNVRQAALDTKRWLVGRRVDRHLHLRPDRNDDWSRIARILAGEPTGLVLSGGGARGFAHLGILKAMEEAKLSFDMVGGTSMGAAMGAFAAMDYPAQELIERAKAIFRTNPTGDYNLVPLVSLISGQRMRKAIDTSVINGMGGLADIEDLWKPYFCISSNYSTASETVLRSGSLATSIRASVSIPGALPPVMIDGDLHIDGGTFNNFPTDVMRRLGAQQVIGVDLLRERNQKFDLQEMPSARQLFADKISGKRNKIPSLTSLLLNASMISSYARQKESRALVDVYFSPPVHRYGMLDWSRFNELVELGYTHACEELSKSKSLRNN